MSFSPGVSFYDTTPGTATVATASYDALHSLIISAEITGVTAGEHDPESYLIFSKDVRPTDSEDQTNRTMWFDEVGGNLWQRAVPGPAGSGFYYDFQTLFDGTNSLGNQDVPKGALVVSDGLFTFNSCATASYPFVTGVATSTLLTTGEYARVAKFGLYEVLVEGPILPGDLLISSATTGYARSGTFQTAMHYTMDLTIGQALYSLGAVSQLVTCLVTL